MRHIVVIDDNAEALETISLMVGSMGIAHVDSFNNAAAALDFIRTNAIDLILCDWNMPEISGLDLLKTLRSEDNPTPFIMVTARNDLDSVLDARRFGVNLYISKPFSMTELKEKIYWIYKQSPNPLIKSTHMAEVC